MGAKRCMFRLLESREEIIDRYEKGKSIDALGSTFQVNPSTMRRFLLAQNVMLRPPIRPQLLASYTDEVKSLYRSGWNTRQLADKFQVDRNTVSSFLSKKGILRQSALDKREFFIVGDANIGLLAGLLLGEGSIIVRNKGVAIRIVNQDPGIIDWLAQWGGSVHWYKPRERCPNPIAVWDLCRAVDVFHCLIVLTPLLVGKKRHLAEDAIEHLRTNYDLEIVSIPVLQQ